MDPVLLNYLKLARQQSPDKFPEPQEPVVETPPAPPPVAAPAPTPAPEAVKSDSDAEVNDFMGKYDAAQKRDEVGKRFNTFGNEMATVGAMIRGNGAKPIHSEYESQSDKLIKAQGAKDALYRALRAKAGIKMDALMLDEKRTLVHEQGRKLQDEAATRQRENDPNSEESRYAVALANQYGNAQFAAGKHSAAQVFRVLPALKEMWAKKIADQNADDDREMKREDLAGRREDRKEVREARIEAKNASDKAKLEARRAKADMGAFFQVPETEIDKRSFTDTERNSFSTLSTAAIDVRQKADELKRFMSENHPGLSDFDKRNQIKQMATYIKLRLLQPLNMGTLTGNDMSIVSSLVPAMDSIITQAESEAGIKNLPVMLDKLKDQTTNSWFAAAVAHGLEARQNAPDASVVADWSKYRGVSPTKLQADGVMKRSK